MYHFSYSGKLAASVCKSICKEFRYSITGSGVCRGGPSDPLNLRGRIIAPLYRLENKLLSYISIGK